MVLSRIELMTVGGRHDNYATSIFPDVSLSLRVRRLISFIVLITGLSALDCAARSANSKEVSYLQLSCFASTGAGTTAVCGLAY
jgi:hypothetical protein